MLSNPILFHSILFHFILYHTFVCLGCTSTETRAWFVLRTRSVFFFLFASFCGMCLEQSTAGSFSCFFIQVQHMFEGKQWFLSFQRYESGCLKLTFGFMIHECTNASNVVCHVWKWKGHICMEFKNGYVEYSNGRFQYAMVPKC